MKQWVNDALTSLLILFGLIGTFVGVSFGAFWLFGELSLMLSVSKERLMIYALAGGCILVILMMCFTFILVGVKGWRDDKKRRNAKQKEGQ